MPEIGREGGVKEAKTGTGKKRPFPYFNSESSIRKEGETMAGRGAGRTAGKTEDAKRELAKAAENLKEGPAVTAEERTSLEKTSSPSEGGRSAVPIAEERFRALPEGRGMIRLLRAEEIECRVATINEKGLSLLLFKDARVDQKILDEVFTPFGWKRSHQSIDGNLYCTVEVWDPVKGQWIAKQDVGTTSYAEKEKGQASDSFKRACFNWGVGRELYTAPLIWVPSTRARIEKKGDRYVTADRFSVHSISYNGQREIISLSIQNNKGVLVFEMQEPKPEPKEPPRESGASMQESALQKKEGLMAPKQFWLLEQELERTGVTMEAILERYHIRTPEEITDAICAKALEGLKKTKNRAA